MIGGCRLCRYSSTSQTWTAQVKYLTFQERRLGLFDALFERFAPDKLHDQVRTPLILEKVNDLWEVGVSEL